MATCTIRVVMGAGYSRVNDRRADLVQAAVVVLRRVGFERMRLRDVAKEAGVSIGLLQHYFETREQLGREAFAAACGDRARTVAASGTNDGPAWSRITRMLNNAFEPEGIRERAATWLDLCSSASRDPGLRQEAIRVQDVWREPLSAAIAEGQDSGDLIPRIEPAVVVDLLLAVIDGTELAATIGDDAHKRSHDILAATLAMAHELLGVQTAHNVARVSELSKVTGRRPARQAPLARRRAR